MVVRKLFVLLAMAFAVCFDAVAQDIIFLTNGDEIEAKVVKVTETELEYKRYDNPDGPSYTRSLSNVFMVKYENGVKDVFTTPETVKQQQQTVYDGPSMGEHSPLTLSRSGAYIVSNVGALKNEDLKRLLGDEAWNEYMSARKGYDAGNTVAAFGVAVGVLGIMGYIGAVNTAIVGDGSVSGVLYVVSTLAIVAHAVMTPVGYVRRGVAAGQISRIAEGYNNYNKSLSMELSVAPTLLAAGDGIAPGIGMSVRF